MDKKDCVHEYEALGFEVVEKKDDRVEAIASVFCIKCSMFRTKILMFRREFPNQKTI